MNFVKKNFKLIVGIIIGAVLISGISVYATTFANQITYTINGRENINSVEDALNDLYSKVPTKTLLWTNLSPNSTFEAQEITLSSPLANFTHILIKWKSLKSSETIYDDIFKLSPNRNGQIEQARFALTAFNSDGNAVYNRRMDCVSNNNLKLNVTNSSKVNNSGNDNDRIIPIEIYGLNISY